MKTLHPKILGAILADPEKHQDELHEHNIEPVSLVVCNFYPFKDNPTISNIDIGGPTMINAASKGYEHVLPVSDPNQYDDVMKNFDHYMHPQDGMQDRRNFARQALATTAQYYAKIASNFPGGENNPDVADDLMVRVYKKKLDLKYGCNSHERPAAVYGINGAEIPFKHLNGDVGFINCLDVLQGWWFVKKASQTFGKIVAASMKHYNLAGGAMGDDAYTAYRLAREADWLASFGDFIVISGHVDKKAAEYIKKQMSNGIIAPSYDKEALEILAQKQGGTYCILQVNEQYMPQQTEEFREVGGCALSKGTAWIDDYNKWFDEILAVQQDENETNKKKHRRGIVTEKKEISKKEKKALLFAKIALEHTPSNAVIIGNEEQRTGVAGGQQKRVDAVHAAGEKTEEWRSRTGNKERITVLASDAFFPFKDNIEKASLYGVTAVVQPGGSMRDGEVIEECNKHGISMVFTDRRDFLH